MFKELAQKLEEKRKEFNERREKADVGTFKGLKEMIQKAQGPKPYVKKDK